MNRISVSSSSIASIGYDSATRILEVEFHNGSIYQYFGVPDQRYVELMGAPSKGTYFNAHIKNGGYRYVQVR